ncbi:MAG: AAA-like domain-containing protein [Treponema sp.]|nr:AAA-like domain-containing protein [Treponema sp.]
MRRFNVTGLCTPEEDYMVDISGKIKQIKQLVDMRCYFTINRARQYGKTTTLNMLKRTLSEEYICISLSFEGVGKKMFANPKSFCQRFLWQLDMATTNAGENDKIVWQNDKITDFDELSVHLTQICSIRKIVLMIDEVDKASNHEVFLLFLGMLRNKFNERKGGTGAAFHSVLLAGVHDIKNIKSKMMSDGKYNPIESEDKKYDSPWNIAVDFNVDMSFNSSEIATMLKEYEADHNTGMNAAEISEEIHIYTNGYPFLVSRICQCIDRELDKDWTAKGIQNAVRILLLERNTLFDDMFKNLENNKELYDLIYDALIVGTQRTFTFGNPTINMAYMYGIIKRDKQFNCIAVSNKIYEIILADYFISKDEASTNKKLSNVLPRDVVRSGRFDMELCLRKFAEHYVEIFNEHDEKFLERHGRLIFLSYLRPLINGQGFYHLESQFTDLRRMDIVVDYGTDQFIIELKIWDGEKEHQEAYEQLLGYMGSKKAAVGYLLTFDLRKEVNKDRKMEWVEIDGKKIFDVII